MKGRLLVLFAALALTAAAAGAQVDTQRCPPGTVNGLGVPDQARASQDACQKAIDLFKYMAPQLGTSVTGGNATLGQGGSLGGLGHFSVGLRVNAVQGSLPQIQNVTPSVTGATSTKFDTKTQIIPMPTADLSIGIFKGLPLAITNVGGIDLLVSAAYLPEFNSGGVSVKVPNGSLKLGYGARVGILQESLLVPGISVSYLRRDLPTVNIAANANNDSLYVNNLSLKTNAFRLVASKSLLLFGLIYIGFKFLKAFYKELVKNLEIFKKANKGAGEGWTLVILIAVLIGTFLVQLYQVISPIVRNLCVYKH